MLLIILSNRKITFRMMLVMHHTLDRQQLLVPNVPLDVSKKKNATDHQTLNVDQTSTGLNVITVLKKIVNTVSLVPKNVQMTGQNVV